MLKGVEVVVLVTSPSPEEGEKIAKLVLERKLAACVNIIKNIKSFFWWQGKIEEAEETLLIMKTRLDVLPELTKSIRENHSYSVPEIIALPIVAGLEDYIKWLNKSICSRASSP